MASLKAVLYGGLKVSAAFLCLALVLALALLIYTRVKGPLTLPLSAVYRLASWQSHNSTVWRGKGELLVYMEEKDLVPRGKNVRRLPPFDSAILGGGRALLVYLPEGYDRGRAKPYPVIYALHGFGDRPNNWVVSLLPWIEKAMEENRFPPAIVVMPDFSISGSGETPKGLPTDGRSGSWYVNSDRGRFRDHFFLEIVPFAEKNFNTRRDPGGRCLLGNSMGGYGVLYYSIVEPGFAGHIVSIYPAADLRYAVGGKRLAPYDEKRYRPLDLDDPGRAMMNGAAGMLAVGENFFLYPVFDDGGKPGPYWKDHKPVWERLRDVNPVDLLRDKKPSLRGNRYYIIAGDRDQFGFGWHLPVLIPLLKARGAAVFPEQNLIPGMIHGWWQTVHNQHKTDVIEWVGAALR